MKSMFILSCIFILFCSSAVFAACPQDQTHYSDTDVQRGGFGDGRCYTMITPLVIKKLVYRSYLLASDGLFSVFNSFGDGPEATHTGMRTFRFFPRIKPLDVAYDARANELSVQLTNGDVGIFFGKTAQITGVGQGEVTVDPVVKPALMGGVEFPVYNGLILDMGWKMGASAESFPKGTSTFRDAQGQTCDVTNSEVISYLSGGNTMFKFSDVELSAFLKQRCPNLTVGF